MTLEWCKQHGLTPVSTRWLYTNKGDLDVPEIRARLVAQETRRVSELSPEDAAQTFAATPPVEALRFLLSDVMTGPNVSADDTRILAFSISAVHISIHQRDDRLLFEHLHKTSIVQMESLSLIKQCTEPRTRRNVLISCARTS